MSNFFRVTLTYSQNNFFDNYMIQNKTKINASKDNLKDWDGNGKSYT